MSRVSRMLVAVVYNDFIGRDRLSMKMVVGGRLRAMGYFSALYLHLHQTGQVERAPAPGKLPKPDAPRLA